MAASHAIVTGLGCWRRERLRSGRVALPRAEVTVGWRGHEPVAQILDGRLFI
jgi:hypothetical protein